MYFKTITGLLRQEAKKLEMDQLDLIWRYVLFPYHFDTQILKYVSDNCIIDESRSDFSEIFLRDGIISFLGALRAGEFFKKSVSDFETLIYVLNKHKESIFSGGSNDKDIKMTINLLFI